MKVNTEELLTYLILIIIGYFIAKMFSGMCSCRNGFTSEGVSTPTPTPTQDCSNLNCEDALNNICGDINRFNNVEECKNCTINNLCIQKACKNNIDMKEKWQKHKLPSVCYPPVSSNLNTSLIKSCKEWYNRNKIVEYCEAAPIKKLKCENVSAQYNSAMGKKSPQGFHYVCFKGEGNSCFSSALYTDPDGNPNEKDTYCLESTPAPTPTPPPPPPTTKKCTEELNSLCGTVQKGAPCEMCLDGRSSAGQHAALLRHAGCAQADFNRFCSTT